MYFTSGFSLRCCFDDAKSLFFRAFNAIFSKTCIRTGGFEFASQQVRALVLYVVEACLLLARQTLSFEFTLTRIFMKLFRTGSSKVVNKCQVSFGFLPVKSRIHIRTASFLQKFTVSACLCMLFANDARRQLHNIFLYKSW